MAYISFQPSDFFNTKLYTGNNSTNAQTGVGFQPDLVWFKKRSGAAPHSLFDSVRGVTKALASNSTDAEFTITDALTSFDSDGFTLGADSGNYINYNTATYAAWNWKANGAGSSNTDGSITSTVSANTTSGFSIVKYTGTGANATIGHGLGVAPKMVMVKNTSTAENWIVGHKSLGFTNFLSLDVTNAAQATSNRFNDTDPTSSVFSVGSADGTNKSGDTIIAYCFAEKKGFSKFGSYTGNGNNAFSNKEFVYTGFKPAFVMFKQTDSTSSWTIVDTKRDTYNPTNKRLFPNLSNADNTSLDPFADLVSNGFKLQTSSGAYNASGGTYLYMAFGQTIVGTNNIPCTAR